MATRATLFVVLWLVIKWRGQELSSQRIIPVRLKGHEDGVRIVELAGDVKTRKSRHGE